MVKFHTQVNKTIVILSFGRFKNSKSIDLRTKSYNWRFEIFSNSTKKAIFRQFPYTGVFLINYLILLSARPDILSPLIKRIKTSHYLPQRDGINEKVIREKRQFEFQGMGKNRGDFDFRHLNEDEKWFRAKEWRAQWKHGRRY